MSSAEVGRVDAEVADAAREDAVVVGHVHGDVSHPVPGVRDLGDGPLTDAGADVLHHALGRGHAEPGRRVGGVQPLLEVLLPGAVVIEDAEVRHLITLGAFRDRSGSEPHGRLRAGARRGHLSVIVTLA